jgi:pimeloyl-ACP methyl ester carboxylesterase
MLPGAYMAAADYADNGFFAAVAARHLALDVVAIDLDLAAISAGEALPAVAKAVLVPARSRYRRVWLGGISLGGLLALGCAADALVPLDGLCLIAPYPGSRLTTNAIAEAGGLDIWEIAAAQQDDPEFRIWNWLRRPPAELPVFVGWGREDRFAQGMAAIAGRFPESARCCLPGDHDWLVWKKLWENFLDRGHFPSTSTR